MKSIFITTLFALLTNFGFAQYTYMYFQNNTSLDFAVSSSQTGPHTMESNEWWGSSSSIAPWQKETNVLWTSRDAGIHNGTDFFLTVNLINGSTSIDLKLKLNGNFIGSDIWSAASGPGFSDGWSSDNNFHSSTFSIGTKQYELKYTFYFTGGYDDILFTLHEINAFTADPSDLADPSVMNVLAYNTYMLSVPVAISDQGTRAQYIDESVHNLDAILIQEAFDNSARATLLSELAIEYPYQTAVVDLPNILEDGGVMIVSRWPIEYEEQMVWTDCNNADCLANKGVMYARINKLGKKYHLFSTHQQAFNENDDVAVRNLQMQQFNSFIDAQNIPADEAVIFGGDMNVDKHSNKLGEYDNMFSIFNASEPNYIGYQYTWDPTTNHYINVGDAPEYLDYVLADNDYKVPDSQTNSVWILRSDQDEMWNIHDLSDHYGVLGRFTYTYPFDPCDNTLITVSSTSTEESAPGTNDGSIDITVNGGLAPYSFAWSNGSISEDLTGLTGGTYTVSISDANGCTEMTEVTVTTNTTCSPASGTFAINPLTHSGSGSSTVLLNLPAQSQDVSFNISEIGQKTGGNSSRRYIEFVTVSYTDGAGNSQTYGTYNGSITSSANINIIGSVQSISIELEDVYDGNSSSTMSVLLSTVNYCVIGGGCPDSDGDGICDDVDACPGQDDSLIGSICNDGNPCTENDIYDANCGCSGTFNDDDGDGVCNANDVCPGGDDNLDTDGDGIPDFCDTGNCNQMTNVFALNPLTHSGSGSSSTSLNLSAGSSDVEFSISNIGSVLSGKGSGRYIENVTVTYIDGNGITQNYGSFNGTGTENIAISGAVQSVTVSLADAYDGNSSTLLSVNLSDVTSCGAPARFASTIDLNAKTLNQSIEIYPNPTNNLLYLQYENTIDKSAYISVYSADGKERMRQKYEVNSKLQLDVSNLNGGIYLLQVVNEFGEVRSFRFVKE